MSLSEFFIKSFFFGTMILMAIIIFLFIGFFIIAAVINFGYYILCIPTVPIGLGAIYMYFFEDLT